MEEFREKLKQEIIEFKSSLEKSKLAIKKYRKKLKDGCETKSVQLWKEYDYIKEELDHLTEEVRRDISDLDEEMHTETTKEDRIWQRNLLTNNRILDEMERWLKDLSSHKNLDDDNILEDLEKLDAKLTEKYKTWNRPREECEFRFQLPDYWQTIMKPFQTRDVGSVLRVRKTLSEVDKIIRDKRFELTESNDDRAIQKAKKNRDIRLICVDKNNGHVLLCDVNNCSLIEMKDDGQILNEFSFSTFVKKGEFNPYDMCLISSENIVAVCGENFDFCYDKKLFFFERQKNFPFLKLKNFVESKKNFCSLCDKNGTIFVLDEELKILLFSTNGDEIGSFEIEGLNPTKLNPLASHLRVDPSNGDFWFSNFNHPDLICLDSKGKKIKTIQKKERFIDFSFNEFQQIFFCDLNGKNIFCFPNQKLFKFQEHRDVFHNRIFVCENKIFVIAIKNGKIGIEIFKIFY